MTSDMERGAGAPYASDYHPHPDYSKRYKRYYYCNDAIGFNSWDMPKKVWVGGCVCGG